MATCPHCGVRGREDPEAFKVYPVLVAKPLGTHSLAGAQMKVSVVSMLRLKCRRCGWHIDGRIVEDRFEGDPSTEWVPPERTGDER